MNKSINLVLPQSWEDLTSAQLKKIGRLFFSPANERFFDLHLFIILLSLRWFEFKKLRELRLVLSQCTLSELKKSFSFIYTKSNRKTFIPVVKISGKKYFGPKPFLFDLTIEQFSIVDDLYFKFRSAKDPITKREFLEYIASILYAPKTRATLFAKARLRREFSLFEIEELRAPFKNADHNFLLAMLLSYQGSRFLLEKRYKRVFTGSSGQANKKKYGFGKVILSMAGQKFGTHQETKKTLLHTFLEQLEEDLTPRKK